jgi:hypothetical protein
MIRLGIVDFDTSHCVEFTRRLNHIDIDPSHWVEGARVVAGCPGTSQIAHERIAGFTEQMRSYGVRLVERPTDLIGEIDAVLVVSLDGSVHLDRARPFLDAGIPCFVDKPFACSVRDAEAMVELAERRGVPLFSASAIRYAPELVAFVAAASQTGAILGAFAYGPAPTRPRNPGLFHYGIHPTELLFTLMGPHWQRVTCLRDGGGAGSEETGVDVATGEWTGGRLGTVRGIRTGTRAYGFVAFCENGPRHVAVGTEYVYRELLRQIVGMFQTGCPPLDPGETLSLIAYLEAALTSGTRGGEPVGRSSG